MRAKLKLLYFTRKLRQSGYLSMKERRMIAENLHINVLGLLGCLVQAKHLSLIPQVKNI